MESSKWTCGGSNCSQLVSVWDIVCCYWAGKYVTYVVQLSAGGGDFVRARTHEPVGGDAGTLTRPTACVVGTAAGPRRSACEEEASIFGRFNDIFEF